MFYLCLLFPRPSTIFTDWYHVCLFHGLNISFYYTIGRKILVLHVYFHACLFFNGLVPCQSFHSQDFSFCNRICKNFMFLRVNLFHSYFFRGLVPCLLFSRVEYLVLLHYKQEFKVLYQLFPRVYTFSRTDIFSPFVTVRESHSFTAYAGVLCFEYIYFFHACLLFPWIDTLFTFITLRIFYFYTP